MEELELKEGYADVNGAKLYYQEKGHGHPLVLLHAGVADHTMWDQQFDLFAQKYRVVRYDLRGFGNSVLPPGPFTTHEDLRGLLDFLGIDRTYLVGVSMGGGTVIDFTVTYPERVAALVPTACSVSGMEASDISKQLYSAMDAPYEAHDLEAVLALEEKLWLVGPNRQPEAVSDELKEWFRRMERANLQREFQGEEGERQGLNPPAIDQLAEIKVPLLYIAGDADLAEVQTAADLIRERVEGAEVVMLENVAHMVPMEAPEQYNSLVLQFLAKCDVLS